MLPFTSVSFRLHSKNPVGLVKVLLLISVFGFNTGCDESGGGGGGNELKTGYLTAGGIAGLPYQTESRIDITDDQGRFFYFEGETISFFLGDLTFAENIPTKEYLTPIDFLPSAVATIDMGSRDRELMTHRLLEKDAIELPEIINKTRILLTLRNTDDDEDDIDAATVISAETREAVESYVFSVTIDFTKPADEFGVEEEDAEKPTLPETIFVDDICEILEQPQCRGDSFKEVQGVQQGRDYNQTETDEITTLIGETIFQDPKFLEIPADLDNLYRVNLQRIGPDLDIMEMEVKTIDQIPEPDGNFPDFPKTVVEIIDYSAVDQYYEFVSVGEAGQETKIIANVKLAKDYRWHQKDLRVRLD